MYIDNKTIDIIKIADRLMGALVLLEVVNDETFKETMAYLESTEFCTDAHVKSIVAAVRIAMVEYRKQQ
jgi:hypothetical protein